MAWAVMPLAAGWHGRVILSGSMVPEIDPGDVVLTVGVDPAKLRPGQVIAFRDPARPGRVDVHRIVRRNDDGTFVTRGDANAEADSTPLPPSNIVGMPRLLVPWVGLPHYWWSQHDYARLGVTLAVLLVAVCVVFSRPGTGHQSAGAPSADSGSGGSGGGGSGGSGGGGKHRRAA